MTRKEQEEFFTQKNNEFMRGPMSVSSIIKPQQNVYYYGDTRDMSNIPYRPTNMVMLEERQPVIVPPKVTPREQLISFKTFVQVYNEITGEKMTLKDAQKSPHMRSLYDQTVDWNTGVQLISRFNTMRDRKHLDVEEMKPIKLTEDDMKPLYMDERFNDSSMDGADVPIYEKEGLHDTNIQVAKSLYDQQQKLYMAYLQTNEADRDYFREHYNVNTFIPLETKYVRFMVNDLLTVTGDIFEDSAFAELNIYINSHLNVKNELSKANRSIVLNSFDDAQQALLRRLNVNFGNYGDLMLADNKVNFFYVGQVGEIEYAFQKIFTQRRQSITTGVKPPKMIMYFLSDILLQNVNQFYSNLLDSIENFRILLGDLVPAEDVNELFEFLTRPTEVNLLKSDENLRNAIKDLSANIGEVSNTQDMMRRQRDADNEPRQELPRQEVPVLPEPNQVFQQDVPKAEDDVLTTEQVEQFQPKDEKKVPQDVGGQQTYKFQVSEPTVSSLTAKQLKKVKFIYNTKGYSFHVFDKYDDDTETLTYKNAKGSITEISGDELKLFKAVIKSDEKTIPKHSKLNPSKPVTVENPKFFMTDEDKTRLVEQYGIPQTASAIPPIEEPQGTVGQGFAMHGGAFSMYGGSLSNALQEFKKVVNPTMNFLGNNGIDHLYRLVF